MLVATLGVGESRLADVYNVANTTPNIIYELVLGGILSSIFVPVFVEVRTTRGQRQAWHVARATMTIAIAGLGLLAAVTMVAAPGSSGSTSTRAPRPSGPRRSRSAASCWPCSCPRSSSTGSGR